MADQLGARLVRCGLVSRDDLARAVAAATLRGVSVGEALVDGGFDERALIELFLSDGYGPLADERVLASRDPEVALAMPAVASRIHLALPIRREADGLVVAMANPTDEHALAELRHQLE